MVELRSSPKAEEIQRPFAGYNYQAIA